MLHRADRDRHPVVHTLLFVQLCWPTLLAAGTIVGWLVKTTTGLDVVDKEHEGSGEAKLRSYE